MDMQADLGLHCPHMPEDMFLLGTAQLTVKDCPHIPEDMFLLGTAQLTVKAKKKQIVIRY